MGDDPFGSTPADKLAFLKNDEEWSTNIGHPGPANTAVGEVFGTFIIPNMMAKAARGELSAKEAVADAEAQIKPIYEKWRERGLVGGSRRRRARDGSRRGRDLTKRFDGNDRTPSTTSAWPATRASTWSCSAPRAAARPRCCA